MSEWQIVAKKCRRLSQEGSVQWLKPKHHLSITTELDPELHDDVYNHPCILMKEKDDHGWVFICTVRTSSLQTALLS